MAFLEKIWDRIQPRVPEGNTGGNLVAGAFMYPWNHDNANMDMIIQLLEIIQPTTVIELGTFEGWGMERIAKAMSKQRGGKLYTFDAGKAPVNSLGPTYGVTEEFIKEKYLVDWENITFPGWESFGKVILKRQERIERMKIEAPNVEITYIEGLTWDTLIEWMPKIGPWDFLFQDTLHDLSSVVKEWNLYSPYARIGSIVVLDDVNINAGVIEYFKREEPRWRWFHTDIGHKQLWGEKTDTIEKIEIVGEETEVTEDKSEGPSGTGRFMCLSCGRFFSMNHKFISQKTICPFCGDLYFCDNIIPDTPPYIVGPDILIFDCGHQIQTDFSADVKYCPVCKKSIDPIPGLKMKSWQEQVIKELSL